MSVNRIAFEVLLSPAIVSSGTKALLLPAAHCPADRISMPNSNEGTSRTISVAILRRVAAGSIRSISVLPAFGLYSFRPSPSGWSVAHIITYSLMLYHGQLRLFEIHSVCNALTASCILCSYLNRTTIRPPSCT